MDSNNRLLQQKRERALYELNSPLISAEVAGGFTERLRDGGRAEQRLSSVKAVKNYKGPVSINAA